MEIMSTMYFILSKLDECYVLNVCGYPPPNSSVETLMLTVVVLGDGAFGMELGHEDTALTMGFMSLQEMTGKGLPSAT